MPCCLSEQRLRKLNKKEFMSNERKEENEIIKYSVNREKQTNASLMKRKRHNLGTETCPSASDESGDKEKSLSISLNLQEAIARENCLIKKKQKNLLPSRSFYPHLYIGPNLNSSYIRKITEVTSPSYS